MMLILMPYVPMKIYEMVLRQLQKATSLIEVKGQAECGMNGQCTL